VSPPADGPLVKIGDHGEIRVPLSVLEAAGLGPRMRVRFRVEGKSLVVEKATDAANPLDGVIGKKPAADLFGKALGAQVSQRDRARKQFEEGLARAAEDDSEPENPANPHMWD
jgi:bifunctional DNA-binding transcriptional regulator/antitoxin component of YhaV-PrlF toxin-antitoxin module